MISRRDTLKLFAGLIVGEMLPVGISSASASEHAVLWREEAAREALPIVEKMLGHPFTKGLLDGSLDRKSFLFYQAENIRYLQAYSKTLRHLAGRLTEENDRSQMKVWADDTVAAEGWARDTYREFAGRDFPESVEITPAAQLYAGWEAQAVAYEPVGVGVAAILPCFWVYGELGHYIAKNVRKKGNPYAGWLSGYGDPAYAETVDRAMTIGDAFAREADEDVRQAMTAAFVRSVRMEWMMWDAAYRRTGWPV